MRKPRTHVLIDSDLFQRVQEKCASQGLTEASATDIAVYALEQWLQQRDMNPALNSDKGLPCEEVSSSFPSPQDSPFVNPFEFAESHPCPYRTLYLDKKMTPKFQTTDDIPIDKFKGIYTKIAKTIFDELLRSDKIGGFLIEKNPKHLKGVYNAMKSLIRQEKYTLDVALDSKSNKIWIKKEAEP